MLDSYENRIGLAVTFGLVVNYCTNVIFTDWARIFTKNGAKEIEKAPSYLGGTLFEVLSHNSILLQLVIVVGLLLYQSQNQSQSQSQSSSLPAA